MRALRSIGALSSVLIGVSVALALTAVRAQGAAVPNELAPASCVDRAEEELSFITQDVCYRGGPVLLDPTVHLIFWQGPVTPNVDEFPTNYVEAIEQYVEGVSHDSGQRTNVFAVDPQYGDEPTPGTRRPGEYKLSFERAADATVDSSTAFPTHPVGEGCTDEGEFSEGPCLLDSDISEEVVNVAKAKSWPTENLENVYVVLTPPGVGGCAETGSGSCAYHQYCAYHSDFGGDGMTPGMQTLYADLPFDREVSGCDSGIHPSSPIDNGADAAIDSASHELNETITDPIGSQCDEQAKVIVGCERNAWTDAIGQEIADKCLPPEATIDGVYGKALGALVPELETSFYNQEIDSHDYWTQRVWSNEAGLLEGACVQRTIGASFNVSTGTAASVPATFDGSSSGAPGDPPVRWVWSFEGEQIETTSPTISYTFAQSGEHSVGLTAYDSYGNSQATTETVDVGAAPPPPTSPIPPVVTEPLPPPAHFTDTQLAAKLHLPANGGKLSGEGPIRLGHAECPPACVVTLRLYAKAIVAVHGHRLTKLVLIGALHMVVATKGVGSLSLVLNAQGRTMLRRLHTLTCRLRVTVEGREGGTWQLVRSLTFTGRSRSLRR